MVAFRDPNWPVSAFQDSGVPDTLPHTLPLNGVATEHLLKVAAAVNKDAAGVWADLWGEFKPHITPNGVVMPDMAKGFVPECGWEEFLERFWLLKHHLDCIARVCQHK